MYLIVFTLHIPCKRCHLESRRFSTIIDSNPDVYMKVPTHPVRNKGFALIVTLSLMILLTVIAVGLLSLSSISLRAAGQGEAMATAKANARLALMLAIGDLQKTLGPDRAVTATSEILGTATAAPTKPNLTGVWESWWNFDPNASPSYTTEKASRFRRWLVSSADPTAVVNPDFIDKPWPDNTGNDVKSVELVGVGSLGTAAPASAKVTAGFVPVAKGNKIQGSYAWHVADESVKARINSYRDPGQNATLAQKRALLVGHRPDPSVMKGADGTSMSFLPTDPDADKFALAKEKSGKLVNLNQVELLDLAKGKTKQFRNDVTPYSLGVLTDVRRGGLKQDLSSVFEMSSGTATILPDEFKVSNSVSKKLYQSTHGITGVSDPYWSTLAGYYNSFRTISTPDDTPTLAVSPSTLSVTANLVPQTYLPGPVIAKVDTIFSLVSRPVTDVSWFDHTNNRALDNYDSFVNLIFTPVVTLHNPYNVNISFYKMSVNFKNVPVAFRFMFQAGGAGAFVSQSVESTKFESLDTMINKKYREDTNPAKVEKSFNMDIAAWDSTGGAISGPIVMKPGQTLVCGPSFDSSKSFKIDAASGSNTAAFDWENTLTKAMKAKPEFTPGLGFETCGVTIRHVRNPAVGASGGSGDWCTYFMMREAAKNIAAGSGAMADQFYVEFQAQKPSWYVDDTSVLTRGPTLSSFKVEALIQTTAGSSPVRCANLLFNYNNDTGLKNFFNNKVHRYPPTGSYSGPETASPGGTTYGAQSSFLHPFAILSAYSRTTNGGVYETGKRIKTEIESPQVNLLQDGRLAGKPFLFHNPSRANVTMNLVSEKPGLQAYEMNLQPFLSKGNYEDYMNVDGNRVPALTGNTAGRGIKSGSYFEIPTGPMQTIADFRRSNALTSFYLPQFVQPVSNSLLHPLMSADKVIESNTAISANALLDHSVLANHALYDRFYFSTFATRGTTVTPDAAFNQFMDGSAPLATQSFQPYLPAGKTISTVKAELFASSKPEKTAYQKAAEYQMVRGPFNVNSTSVQAWKAVLASMNKSDIAILWPKNSSLETTASPGIPILAMSLLNGGLKGSKTDPAKIDGSVVDSKTNDWNGYRELDDIQLTLLAEKIVEQVRLRGPFLSMSEFVNRQVGAESALTLSGALENAITDSKINDTFMSAYVTPLTQATFTDPTVAALYNYKTLAATVGNPAAGAPGWISQGDLLRIIEPTATVRSDTFVIRVCGEAKDASGATTARVFAEAVVQRVPEYVDPVDRPSINAYDITVPTLVTSPAAAANKKFGRRINVVSFRWLSNTEI